MCAVISDFPTYVCPSSSVQFPDLPLYPWQMAFYREFHYFPATYESCSTAAYKHGRTETLRAGTLETKQAAVAFDPRSGADVATKKKLVEKASKKHGALKQEAVMGMSLCERGVMYGVAWCVTILRVCDWWVDGGVCVYACSAASYPCLSKQYSLF